MVSKNQAKDFANAHFEDVIALILGGIIGVPLMIGVATISYFDYSLAEISYTAAGATLSLGTIVATIAGVVSIASNDVRGDVSDVEKVAGAVVVGVPVGYSFVPIVQEAVHYAFATEVLTVVGVIGSFVVLSMMPNDNINNVLSTSN